MHAKKEKEYQVPRVQHNSSRIFIFNNERQKLYYKIPINLYVGNFVYAITSELKMTRREKFRTGSFTARNLF